MVKPSDQIQVNLTYVDRPEITETCVDSLEKIVSDGPTVRMELVVNRIDLAQPPQPMTGQKYTACRLVMPITGFPDMVTKMNALFNALVEQGAIKTITTPIVPISGKPN
jgi:hypothetical protein